MKKLLLFFLSISLLGGHAFGVKRKRPVGDDGGRPSKKRKSIYDQYLGADGKYHCPHCNYAGRSRDGAKNHFVLKRHGHLKGKKINEYQKRGAKRVKGSKYDVYKKDGVYCCPDEGCGYTSQSLKNFQSHLAARGHAGYQRRSGKYNKYLRNGIFHCHNDGCGYRTNNLTNLKAHFSRHGHGDYSKQKSKYDVYKTDGTYYCPEETCEYASDQLKNFTLHLLKSNHGGHGRKTKEKSKYDIHKQGGVFYCPDCSHANEKLQGFKDHLARTGHANYGHRASKYDAYKKDGVYNCPDCSYTSDHAIGLRKHLSETGHAGYQRKNSKYNVYERDGSFYACSACNYKTSRIKRLIYHLKSKRHGGCKQKSRLAISEPISIFFRDQQDKEFQFTVLPTLKQLGEGSESFLHALFNATCLSQDRLEDMCDRERFESVVAPWREKLRKGASVQAFAQENIVIVDGLRRVKLACSQMRETKVIILNLGDDHWIAVKVSCRNGGKSISVADAACAGFEDFEKLVDIIKQLME